jgi:hypothetical protein
MLRNRGVLACGTIAVVLAFGNEWWIPDAHVMSGSFGDAGYWSSRVLWISPYALALVAALVSLRAAAGVLVAGAAVLASLVAVEIDTGLSSLTAGISLHGVLAYLLNVVALVPAAVVVAGRAGRAVDVRLGALTGLACGAVLAFVAFLWMLPVVTGLPAWYVLGGYVFPPVAMATVGLLAGAAAAVPSGAPARTQSTRP